MPDHLPQWVLWRAILKWCIWKWIPTNVTIAIKCLHQSHTDLYIFIDTIESSIENFWKKRLVIFLIKKTYIQWESCENLNWRKKLRFETKLALPTYYFQRLRKRILPLAFFIWVICGNEKIICQNIVFVHCSRIESKVNDYHNKYFYNTHPIIHR